MTKQFLTKEEVFVVKGYLSSSKDKVQPIGNKEFIEVQKHAEYVVKLAEAAKGKDFKGKEADSIDKLKEEVLKSINSNEVVQYIDEPKKPSLSTQDKLKKEALAFIEYQDDKDKVAAINTFLNEFNLLKEFSEVGLFFDQEIVKIDRIYTIEEVVKAVQTASKLFE